MVNLRTEEKNHEYLENGKRYQKMSQNRPPNRPFYAFLDIETPAKSPNFKDKPC